MKTNNLLPNEIVGVVIQTVSERHMEGIVETMAVRWPDGSESHGIPAIITANCLDRLVFTIRPQ